MDLKYKYDVGDLVQFTLTAMNSPKVYRGIIGERHGGVDNYNKKIKVYGIYCIEKGMSKFSIGEVLILGKV